VFGFKLRERSGADIAGSLTVGSGWNGSEHWVKAPGGYTGTSWCGDSYRFSSNGSSSAQ
jgi:hypothetical protein